MKQLLKGLPRMEVVKDDVFIHGQTRAKNEEMFNE